jgi:hypothetical protein
MGTPEALRLTVVCALAMLPAGSAVTPTHVPLGVSRQFMHEWDGLYSNTSASSSILRVAVSGTDFRAEWDQPTPDYSMDVGDVVFDAEFVATDGLAVAAFRGRRRIYWHNDVVKRCPNIENPVEVSSHGQLFNGSEVFFWEEFLELEVPAESCTIRKTGNTTRRNWKRIAD